MATSDAKITKLGEVDQEHGDRVLDEEKIESITSSLPQNNSWAKTLYKYQGCWYPEPYLKGLIILQNLKFLQPQNPILASFPKAGTTWLKALMFTIMNRDHYTYDDHPFQRSNPHDCIPMIEDYANNNPHDPLPKTDIFSTHSPYHLLPDPIRKNSCPIVYVFRDPRDVFISLWKFISALRPKDKGPLPIEQAFESFCSGICPFGPYWEQVLGYWKASVESPATVFFLRYEDLKRDPTSKVLKLAEFMGQKFSIEEENAGVVQKIIDFCSFDNLSQFEANRSSALNPATAKKSVPNKLLYRKGNVGDHKNYLTEEMVHRLKAIMEEKVKGSGLELYA